MIKNFSFLFVLLFISLPLYGQQNLFNIPSGQMTPQSKVFYQHQVNFFSTSSLASKQHFAYGLTETIEVGVNFLNFYPLGRSAKDVEDIAGPEDNILAPTFQKSFVLNEKWALNLGTQAGFSHMGGSRPSYATAFSYALATYYDQLHHLRLTGGNWLSDSRFNGPGDVFGFMAGFEWMYDDGWYLMADWVSGDTKNSVSVIGGMVDVSNGVQVCYGVLVPNPKSAEGNGIVLELNLFTL